MGSATTICSDKTGTLTMNMMTVVKAWACGGLREVEDIKKALPDTILSVLYEGLCQNTNGAVHVPDEGAEPEITGTPTESAVLAWAVKVGARFAETRRLSEVVKVAAFNSEKKRMGVLVKLAVGVAVAGFASSANFARVAIPRDVGDEVRPLESLSKPCNSAVDSEMAGESRIMILAEKASPKTAVAWDT
ncbi:hypothetical protein CBR_g32480 [Chara braunii]|nr:hypothetical protein CBR_g32480 [Chara braunii]|eukprot:GBG81492.1 hypothetical protein CBR_g32480 [Chara braunii]